MLTYTTVIRSWVPTAAQWVMLGILYAICKSKELDTYTSCTKNADGDTLLTVNCAKSEYEEFEELVKDLYPDACVFNASYLYY
jgi:hypothetical protein